MRGLLRRFFGSQPAPVSYESSKRLSASKDPADRRRVAGDGAARPEVLYFLANDPDPSVRAAVAANRATPSQADLLLARDGDEAVRQDLARKIARLAPGLSAQESDRLRRSAYEVLDILVRDQIAKVRQILSEALKDVADAPPEIIQRLARDYEIAVAGPVLQYSPLLSDSDLIEIIGHSGAEAAAAVARRRGVSAEVADAIDRSGDVAAITALLENPSAQIREETLDSLVERAPRIVPWHRPLVMRPALSGKAARKLATFVATDLLETLRARKDLDPETTREVAAVVMRRLAETGDAPAGNAAAAQQAAEAPVPALDRARKMHAAGTLHDEALLTALRQGDRAFVRAGLALLADMPVVCVDKIVAAQSAKGMVSLAWRAGLTMRSAFRLQVAFARIATSAAIEPNNEGGYPLPEEAMRWQLDFLTDGAVR
jgi:uncharacterized protein (DUF2336 family)